MVDTAFPTFRKWFRKRAVKDWLPELGVPWRLSPWWPGDTRQAAQHSLLRILSVAHTQRLDLVPLVNHLADEHRWRYRRILRRFAARLAAGVPVVAALEQTPNVLSDHMILAIRFGNQSGTLPATYLQLLESRTPEASRLRAAARNELTYWTILLLGMVLVLAFLFTAVAPQYVRIAEDSGLSTTAAFRSLMRLADFFSHYPLAWVLAAFALAWLVLSPRSRDFIRLTSLQRLMGAVGQRRSVELFQLLATAVEAGRPIPGSLSTLAKYHFDKDLRQKLLYARNEVEQGVDVWSSLANAGILTPPEARALATSPSASVRAWILRRLASWKQAALHRRGGATLLLVQPVVVLLFASMVLWICTAFFGLLTHYIQSQA